MLLLLTLGASLTTTAVAKDDVRARLPYVVVGIPVDAPSWNELTWVVWTQGVRDPQGKAWPALTLPEAEVRCLNGRTEFSATLTVLLPERQSGAKWSLGTNIRFAGLRKVLRQHEMGHVAIFRRDVPLCIAQASEAGSCSQARDELEECMEAAMIHHDTFEAEDLARPMRWPLGVVDP